MIFGGFIQQGFGTFFILCFFLTITPGSDTALVLRTAIEGNRRLLIAIISGICTGLLVHATLSSLGLTAILQTSPNLYSVLKLAGAGYLIYLGGLALYEAFREGLVSHGGNSKSFKPIQKTVLSEFRTGLLANVLNPKVAVFYLTFLSQFIDPQKNVFLQSILLAGGHILMSIIWLLLIGIFVAYFKPQLEKPKVRRIIETVTGLALIAFGLRLAL